MPNPAKRPNGKEVVAPSLPPENPVAKAIEDNWTTWVTWGAAGVGAAILATVSIPAAAAGATVFAGHRMYLFCTEEKADGNPNAAQANGQKPA